VRYAVTEYVPGRRVEFRFGRAGATAGLDGRHFFEIVPRRDHVVLRHVVDAECDFRNWLRWRFFIETLHDALLEDAFAGAERTLVHFGAKMPRWNPWVRFLRWRLERRRKKARRSVSA
jgi:hypothetical protein